MAKPKKQVKPKPVPVYPPMTLGAVAKGKPC